MNDNNPVFAYDQTFAIKGRGDVYCGPAPFDMDEADLGALVTVDGRAMEIVGIERGARFPRRGERCCLFLRLCY